MTARLQHPAIVPVYEAGRWPGGRPFYAMKLVEGRSLDGLLRDAGSLAARLALLPHLIAVAEAVAYAHGQRVVHRDLKPANVLVGPFGETVVVDWGLARELGAGGAVEREETGRRDRGGGRRPDRHRDRPRHAAATCRPSRPAASRWTSGPTSTPSARCSTSCWPARRRTREGAPRRPWPRRPAGASSRSSGASRRRPPDLVAIARQAMAPAPGDRYPSARELAADLRRFQTGQLVRVHHYSTRELLRRFVRRHRAAVLVASALSAALVLAVAVGFVAVRRQARVAEAERDRARLAARKAEQTNAFVVGMLGSADPRVTRARRDGGLGPRRRLGSASRASSRASPT